MLELRDTLELLDREGFLFRVREPRSTQYEVARELKKKDGEGAVLIEEPVLPDGSAIPFRIVGGVASNVSAMVKVLGLRNRKELRALIRRSIKKGIAAEEVEEAPVKEVGLKDFDLSRSLPILRHYAGEPGPYMTAGIVIARDPDSGLFSASYHRMTPIGPNRLVLRAVEGRKLHRLVMRAEETNVALELSVAIGVDMGLLLAAATPAEDQDKLGVAGAIRGEPVKLARCETVEGEMPANAEIVLEGRIVQRRRAKEGPFYEMLGKDITRDQPVLEVTKIWRRKDAIYQAIVPASSEHEILMGLPVEAMIEEAVCKVADVRDVSMTPAGFHWIEVGISLRKELEGQPTLAAFEAISAHKSLKRVIVVDEDVDVTNYEELMRAVLQRAHPVMDYKTIEDARGSSLDHSNIRYFLIDGRKSEITLPQCKVIIDATIKGPKELFERAVIPE